MYILNLIVILADDKSVLMNIIKYRVKTEQEFLDEYGEEWRYRLYEFSHGMNYLLGHEFNDDQSNISLKVIILVNFGI